MNEHITNIPQPSSRPAEQNSSVDVLFSCFSAIVQPYPYREKCPSHDEYEYESMKDRQRWMSGTDHERIKCLSQYNSDIEM